MARFSVVLASLLFAVPLSAAPVPKTVKKPAAPPLAGTTWVGTNGNEGTYEYTFNADGTFNAEQNGKPYSTGHWKQEGNSLEWDFNNRYAVYTLTFADKAFEGTAVNIKGKSWPVILKPVEK